MTEMKRLLDDDLSAKAERILRSADTDVPSSQNERQDRILAALGAARTIPTLGKRNISRSVLRTSKWAALVAIIVFAGVVATRSSSSSPAVNPSAAVTPEVTARSVPPARSDDGIHIEDLPNVPENGGAIAARREAGPARPSRSRVEDELAAVDAARAALAAGKSADALARVEDCRRRFQNPRFGEEVDVLEVQALAALGRRDQARAKGERFLSSRPRSPYEQRVRSAMTPTAVKP